MRRSIFSAAIAVLIAVLGVGASATDGLSPERYEVRVRFDAEAGAVRGEAAVTAVNGTDRAIDELPFCLLANWGAQENPYLHPAVIDSQYIAGFDPTWTRIDAVTDENGTPLRYRLDRVSPEMQTYSLDDGLMVVELGASVPPGGTATIRILFETKFARGYLLDQCAVDDLFVWRFAWHPILVPSSEWSGELILPSAEYRVELSVPEGYRAFGGADRQSLLDPVNGEIRHLLESESPVRSVPLVIGTDLHVVSSIWRDGEILAVHRPGHEAFARLVLSYAAEILADYTERYGPAGYRRIVIAESPSPGLYGMAADGMILLGTDFARLKDMPALGTYDRLLGYLIAHELAHLWWGIGVGADLNAENWLSEGFAEYASIGYFERIHGGFGPNVFSHLGDGLVEEIVRDAFGWMNLRQHNVEAVYLDVLRNGFDEPLVRPLAEVEYLNALQARTYKKGYLVLRALEGWVGEETLAAALAGLNAEWRGRIVSVEAFEHLLEASSGQDLSRFFSDWVWGDAQFDAAVERFDVARDETGFVTTVHLRRIGAALPVEVEVIEEDGAATRQRWIAATETGSLVFRTQHPVVSVRVDPDEQFPDRNRFNNHVPRKIQIDHPFRAPDAPPIGRPLDAYAVRITPTGVSGGFRNDHLWSIAAMPYIPALPAIPGEIGAGAWGAWEIVGQFAANVDRGLSIAAVGELRRWDPMQGTGDLDLRIAVQRRFFSHPETGSAGRYWYPSDLLDLRIGALGPIGGAVPYLAAAWTTSELLTRYTENAIEVIVGVPGLGAAPFGSVEWSRYQRIRIAPNLYVDLDTIVSERLFGEIPDDFLFSLDRLHAFPYPAMGQHQVYAGIELILPPLARRAGYAILNLTRMEAVTASLFVHGGRTESDCERTCNPQTRIEAGAKLTLGLAGILGLPLEVGIGYAVPAYGADGAAGIFFEFRTPL